VAARLAQLWARRAGRAGQPLPVHLALNAGGVSRTGVELSTASGQADARAILAQRALRPTGAMTHYPSEEADDILGQLAHFRRDLDWLAG
ncbi:alanine racemase, partial [Acinetobacter baumannii]